MHLFLLLALTAVSPDWSQAAQSDLAAMHQAILDNHPGPVDPFNPGFRRWLEQGYARALARAKSAHGFPDYLAALRSYQAGFRDGHLGLRFAGELPAARWPGFVVAFRDGKFLVRGAEADAGVPNDAELVDCDGRSPRTLMEERVFPFRGNPALEASWTRFAPELLVDRGIAETAPLTRCRYRVGQSLETVALHYRPIDEAALQPKLESASFGAAPPFGARPFGKDGVWVSIPTFGEGAQPEFEKLIAQAPSWRNASTIVFDLRGNDGGNSAWGRRILEALYGKEFLEATVQAKVDRPGEYVEWRVSKGNLDYLGTLLPRLEKQLGSKADETLEFAGVRRSMERALAAHQPLVREAERRTPITGHPASPVHARLIALTDGRCVSACLDFVDVLLVLPDAHQVGWPTSADSTYLELRPIPLPSGHATLALAIKVYRNRLRANNEPYIPLYRFHGEISDTAALEEFISRLQVLPLTP